MDERLEQLRNQMEDAMADLTAQRQALADELTALQARGQDLIPHIERLESEIAELVEKRDALQAEVASLQDLRDATRTEYDAVSSRVDRLSHEQDDLTDRVRSLRNEVEELVERRAELHHLTNGHAQAAVEPEVEALSERIRQTAPRLSMSPDELRIRLYGILDRLEADSSLDDLVNPKRRELQSLDGLLAERRAQIHQMEQHLHALQADQERIGSMLPALREEATADIKRAGADAAKAIRDAAKMMRKEMDALFEEALELGARAAQIDADLRSKEWYSHLLTAGYGRSYRGAPELQESAVNALEAFQDWLDHSRPTGVRRRPDGPGFRRGDRASARAAALGSGRRRPAIEEDYEAEAAEVEEQSS